MTLAAAERLTIGLFRCTPLLLCLTASTSDRNEASASISAVCPA
jgi:hypothetical protein